MKTSIILICGLLVILVIFFSTAPPQGGLPWQQEDQLSSQQSPTPTAQNGKTPLHRQSGDTQGLKIGAAVIVLIILGGILIQGVESQERGSKLN